MRPYRQLGAWLSRFAPSFILANVTVNEQLSRAERLVDLVAPKLQLVEEELRRNFQSQIQTIHDVGDHILGGGGKPLKVVRQE